MKSQAAEQPAERKSVRITERPTEVFEVGDLDWENKEKEHKHGISCSNIRKISKTAWVIVAGDCIEQVVHGY